MFDWEQNIASRVQTFLGSLISSQPEAEATAPEISPVPEQTAFSSVSSSSFSPRATTRGPDVTAGPRVGHPVFCREMPSEASTVSLEDFTADFDCRLQTIEEAIAEGDFHEASRLIDATNASWRSFNAAHTEIPQSDRNALLGRLYLAQAALERARGPQREAYAVHYEARGYDLTGDHVRARLRYNEFMRMPMESWTRDLAAMGRLSAERRRTLELEALDGLTTVTDRLLEQRGGRLFTDSILGSMEDGVSDSYLGLLRQLITSGRAHTISEAITMLREDHLRGRSEFEAHPTIPSDWRITAWRSLTTARLEGGTLALWGMTAPRLMTVTVGREGGVIRVPGADYYFPASDHDVTVHLMGARVTHVGRGGEALRRGEGYYVSEPGTGDRDIPREVLALGGETRREYHPGSATARIHPNTFDRLFDDQGGYRPDGLVPFDSYLVPMLEMETEEGLEHLASESTRGGYLISVAERMRARDGSYALAAECLEEVFEGELGRAIDYIATNRAADIEELREDSDNNEEFQAALGRMVTEQMETWSDSGELAASDPVAARAWSIYNDMLNPADQRFNIADESWDAIGDEAIITPITLLPTLRLGAAAAEAVRGVRAVRLAAAIASVGTRRLLFRFGPRIAALGARAAFGLVGGGAAITARVAVETPAMTLGGTALSGRHADGEALVEGSLVSGGHLMVYHTVGAVLPRPLRFVAESFLGRDLGEYAAGSAARRMGLRLYFHGSSFTAITGLATGLSYTNASDDRTWDRRIAGEGLRMGYMTLLGGMAGEGASSEAGRPTFLSDLREMGRDLFRHGVPIPAFVGVEGFGFIFVGARRGGAMESGVPASYRDLAQRLHVFSATRGHDTLMTDFATGPYERTPVAEAILNNPNLRPRTSVRVGDRTFYLGPVIRTVGPDGPRLYSLGVVPILEGGAVRLREVIFYRSNSDGGWRVTPARMGSFLMKGRLRMGSEARGHYTQETQLAPEISQRLEGLEGESVVAMGEDELNVFINIESPLNDGRFVSLAGRFGDQQRLSMAPGLEAAQRFVPGRERFWRDGGTPSGMDEGTWAIVSRIAPRIADLGSLPLPEAFIPDFTGEPLRTYEGRHTTLGETTYREYRGTLNGNDVVWTMAEATGDRVWVQSIRYAEAQVTDFGTYDVAIDSGILTSKPVEYTSQLGNLPESYRRPILDGDGSPTPYEDITPLLAELEPIRRYREARAALASASSVAVRPIIAVGDVEVVPASDEELPTDPGQGGDVDLEARQRALEARLAGLRAAAGLEETQPASAEDEVGIRGLGPSSMTFLPVDIAIVRAQFRLGGVSIGSEMIPAEGGGSTIVVHVPGAEAGEVFLNGLREQPGATVEDLGGGRYRVGYEGRGEAMVEVRQTTDLTPRQQSELNAWFDVQPDAIQEEGYFSIRSWSRAVFENLIHHLRRLGWERPAVEQFVIRYGGEDMRPQLDEVLAQPLEVEAASATDRW